MCVRQTGRERQDGLAGADERRKNVKGGRVTGQWEAGVEQPLLVLLHG